MRGALFVTSFCCLFALTCAAWAQTSVPLAAAISANSNVSSYILGAGDQIHITVFGEQDISGDYLVDSTGYITVPLIGRVAAVGNSTDVLAQNVAQQLSRGNFVQDAHVTASVIAYRPFYILGEVQKPGAYPYAPDMTLFQAVATAGGYTARANRRRVFIQRAGVAQEEAIAAGAHFEVHPGDTLRIGERFF
jgi:polysaccharide export outer membrane protein